MVEIIRSIDVRNLENIADAIREKTGKTEAINLLNFTEEIKNIPGGGLSVSDAIKLRRELIERTITEINDDTIITIQAFAFSDCKQLKTVNLPNCTGLGYYAFRFCTSLSTINLPQVTRYSTNGYHFYQCTGLINVELPLLTVLGNSSFRHAFQTQNSNTRIYAPSVTTLGERCMSECYQLRYIEMPLVTSIGQYAFSECYGLKKIGMPNLTSIPNSAFQWCQAITKEDFNCLVSIAAGGFNNCTSLDTLILRSNTVVTLANTNALTNTPIALGRGYVYVPAALIENYKTATNWSTIVDQFRAIEDYPEICGG